jgi:Rieske Fe-S protein
MAYHPRPTPTPAPAPAPAQRAAAASRRTLLAAGTAGAASLVTGCAVYGEPDPGPAEPAPPADGPADGPPGGGAVARTADVPTGGGLILDGVVITQPASGEFRGFSTTCTHQGCTVTTVGDGTIDCPCHGSRFSIEDGSVVQAAAGLTPQQQNPLPAVAIRVDGDTITRA